MRVELLQQGLLLSLVITGGAFAAIWFGLKKTIKPVHVSFILIGLLIGDLGFLSTDFLHLKKNNVIERQFKPDDVIKFLLNDIDQKQLNQIHLNLAGKVL